MRKRVEEFWSIEGAGALAGQINSYCERYNYNPISISVIQENRAYRAFVVVEERKGDE